jgi:hypothetical protein
VIQNLDPIQLLALLCLCLKEISSTLLEKMPGLEHIHKKPQVRQQEGQALCFDEFSSSVSKGNPFSVPGFIK